MTYMLGWVCGWCRNVEEWCLMYGVKWKYKRLKIQINLYKFSCWLHVSALVKNPSSCNTNTQKGKVHLRKGEEGPEVGRCIDLLFHCPRR